MKRILIIEDNLEVRENLCEILELANYETIQAENGKIGLIKAKDHKPDLILCDVMMPELDGFGVLRIINRDPDLMHIPFMFLTAKAEKADFRKGMGLGADDYIIKPFDEVELLDSIEIRLKKSERLAVIPNKSQGIRQFFSEAKAQEAFSQLSEDREQRKYERKSTVYEVGQYPKFLFYIVSGQVKIAQKSEVGKELISKVCGPGEFFGLLALLEETPYLDTATCSETTEIMLIPAEDFRLAMFNNRDFSAKFMKLIVHNARLTESQLIELAFSSVRKKVSKAILSYAALKQSTELMISREDLAALAGTARETVIRTLAEFKSEGLIDVEEGKIFILDREKLGDMPQ